MAVPKANQRAVNKYVKANYDRINVTMPKGEKEVIQGYAATCGESVNGFIVRAVRDRMDRDGADGPQGSAETAAGSGGILASPDTLAVAQRAAERTGEAVPEFVARAVDTQAQRDKASLRMGVNPATGEKLKREE